MNVFSPTEVIRAARFLLPAGALVLSACAGGPKPQTTSARVASAAKAYSDSIAAAAEVRRVADSVRAESIRIERLRADSARADSIRTDSARVDSIEVARRAREVFGDPPPVPPVVEAATAAPSWDIEVRSYETTARVGHYVRMFTGSAKDRIQSRLQKGTRYEPMIRAKMREGGIPEDMYYLALVESGFDANAYSRAAAVGMWQFMTSTGRDMGLRVDWWVDERRDPVRSTIAAVRFLRGLREQFGSLYLAAAAYNGGPGRVARGLSRYADDLEGTTGEDQFFVLAEKNYLRNETREYVPQLIAAALIAKEPARYGMQLTAEPPFEYDSVKVGPATPLAAIAKAAHANVAAIKELNPHIIRGMTPPRDSLRVRVPPGQADGFNEALAALPREDRVGIRALESKKGESMASIARKYGITAKALSQFNPSLKRLKSGNLAVGQRVLVPTEQVAAAALAVPDPGIERYPKRSRAARTHVVKRGESIQSIAKRYNTSTTALMKVNRLKRPVLFAGQALVLR